MNIFNRIVAVLLFLVFIAAAVVSLMALFGFVLNIPGGLFQQQLAFLQNLSGWERIAAIAAAIAFIALIIGLIRLEFTRRGQPEKSIVLNSNEQGDITVNRESVESIAERTARQESAQVKDVRCRVRERRKGVIVDCAPVLRLGTNMKSLNPRIQTRVKEAIEQLLGLPVLDVKVRAKYEPGSRRPTQQELVTGRSGGDGTK